MKMLLALFVTVLSFTATAQLSTPRDHDHLRRPDLRNPLNRFSDQALLQEMRSRGYRCHGGNDNRLDYICAGRQLKSLSGNLVHSFSFADECPPALEQLRQTRNIFCGGRHLKKTSGENLHSFSFDDDCTPAIQQIVETGNMFCGGRHLKNTRGETIHSYSFDDDCIEALPRN